jgi:glycosyltransferase involved in cell wall biosynthesis
MPAKISIVIPCYNEELNLAALAERLEEVMATVAPDWFEVILIDDGSKDRTVETATELQKKYQFLTLLELSRNFGKEAALMAGIDHADGDCVVIMDADLQHPPEAIVEMLKIWKTGIDVVACRRVDRDTDSFLRSIFSWAFYLLISRGAEVHIPRNVGDFRLMDRRVIKAIQSLRETQRFMKGIYAWVGFKTEIIEFQVAARNAGVSSFNLRKLWHFAWDGITSFNIVPLRFSSYIGAAVAFVAFTYGLFILLEALLLGGDVPGYPSLMTSIAFLGGLQLVGIGMLGEYVGRMYIESKQRPVYIIRETYRGESKHGDEI